MEAQQKKEVAVQTRKIKDGKPKSEPTKTQDEPVDHRFPPLYVGVGFLESISMRLVPDDSDQPRVGAWESWPPRDELMSNDQEANEAIQGLIGALQGADLNQLKETTPEDFVAPFIETLSRGVTDEQWTSVIDALDNRRKTRGLVAEWQIWPARFDRRNKTDRNVANAIEKLVKLIGQADLAVLQGTLPVNFIPAGLAESLRFVSKSQWAVVIETLMERNIDGLNDFDLSKLEAMKFTGNDREIDVLVSNFAEMHLEILNINKVTSIRSYVTPTLQPFHWPHGLDAKSETLSTVMKLVKTVLTVLPLVNLLYSNYRHPTATTAHARFQITIDDLHECRNQGALLERLRPLVAETKDNTYAIERLLTQLAMVESLGENSLSWKLAQSLCTHEIYCEYSVPENIEKGKDPEYSRNTIFTIETLGKNAYELVGDDNVEMKVLQKADGLEGIGLPQWLDTQYSVLLRTQYKIRAKVSDMRAIRNIPIYSESFRRPVLFLTLATNVFVITAANVGSLDPRQRFDWDNKEWAGLKKLGWTEDLKQRYDHPADTEQEDDPMESESEKERKEVLAQQQEIQNPWWVDRFRVQPDEPLIVTGEEGGAMVIGKSIWEERCLLQQLQLAATGANLSLEPYDNTNTNTNTMGLLFRVMTPDPETKYATDDILWLPTSFSQANERPLLNDRQIVFDTNDGGANEFCRALFAVVSVSIIGDAINEEDIERVRGVRVMTKYDGCSLRTFKQIVANVFEENVHVTVARVGQDHKDNKNETWTDIFNRMYPSELNDESDNIFLLEVKITHTTILMVAPAPVHFSSAQFLMAHGTKSNRFVVVNTGPLSVTHTLGLSFRARGASEQQLNVPESELMISEETMRLATSVMFTVSVSQHMIDREVADPMHFATALETITPDVVEFKYEYTPWPYKQGDLKQITDSIDVTIQGACWAAQKAAGSKKLAVVKINFTLTFRTFANEPISLEIQNLKTLRLDRAHEKIIMPSCLLGSTILRTDSDVLMRGVNASAAVASAAAADAVIVLDNSTRLLVDFFNGETSWESRVETYSGLLEVINTLSVDVYTSMALMPFAIRDLVRILFVSFDNIELFPVDTDLLNEALPVGKCIIICPESYDEGPATDKDSDIDDEESENHDECTAMDEDNEDEVNETLFDTMSHAWSSVLGTETKEPLAFRNDDTNAFHTMALSVKEQVFGAKEQLTTFHSTLWAKMSSKSIIGRLVKKLDPDAAKLLLDDIKSTGGSTHRFQKDMRPTAVGDPETILDGCRFANAHVRIEQGVACEQALFDMLEYVIHCEIEQTTGWQTMMNLAALLVHTFYESAGTAEDINSVIVEISSDKHSPLTPKLMAETTYQTAKAQWFVTIAERLVAMAQEIYALKWLAAASKEEKNAMLHIVMKGTNMYERTADKFTRSSKGNADDDMNGVISGDARHDAEAATKDADDRARKRLRDKDLQNAGLALRRIRRHASGAVSMRETFDAVLHGMDLLQKEMFEHLSSSFDSVISVVHASYTADFNSLYTGLVEICNVVKSMDPDQHDSLEDVLLEKLQQGTVADGIEKLRQLVSAARCDFKDLTGTEFRPQKDCGDDGDVHGSNSAALQAKIWDSDFNMLPRITDKYITGDWDSNVTTHDQKPTLEVLQVIAKDNLPLVSECVLQHAYALCMTGILPRVIGIASHQPFLHQSALIWALRMAYMASAHVGDTEPFKRIMDILPCWQPFGKKTHCFTMLGKTHGCRTGLSLDEIQAVMDCLGEATLVAKPRSTKLHQAPCVLCGRLNPVVADNFTDLSWCNHQATTLPLIQECTAVSSGGVGVEHLNATSVKYILTLIWHKDFSEQRDLHFSSIRMLLAPLRLENEVLLAPNHRQDGDEMDTAADNLNKNRMVLDSAVGDNTIDKALSEVSEISTAVLQIVHFVAVMWNPSIPKSEDALLFLVNEIWQVVIDIISIVKHVYDETGSDRGMQITRAVRRLQRTRDTQLPKHVRITGVEHISESIIQTLQQQASESIVAVVQTCRTSLAIIYKTILVGLLTIVSSQSAGDYKAVQEAMAADEEVQKIIGSFINDIQRLRKVAEAKKYAEEAAADAAAAEREAAAKSKPADRERDTVNDAGENDFDDPDSDEQGDEDPDEEGDADPDEEGDDDAATGDSDNDYRNIVQEIILKEIYGGDLQAPMGEGSGLTSDAVIKFCQYHAIAEKMHGRNATNEALTDTEVIFMKQIRDGVYDTLMHDDEELSLILQGLRDSHEKYNQISTSADHADDDAKTVFADKCQAWIHMLRVLQRVIIEQHRSDRLGTQLRLPYLRGTVTDVGWEKSYASIVDQQLRGMNTAYANLVTMRFNHLIPSDHIVTYLFRWRHMRVAIESLQATDRITQLTTFTSRSIFSKMTGDAMEVSRARILNADRGDDSPRVKSQMGTALEAYLTLYQKPKSHTWLTNYFAGHMLTESPPPSDDLFRSILFGEKATIDAHFQLSGMTKFLSVVFSVVNIKTLPEGFGKRLLAMARKTTNFANLSMRDWSVVFTLVFAALGKERADNGLYVPWIPTLTIVNSSDTAPSESNLEAKNKINQLSNTIFARQLQVSTFASANTFTAGVRSGILGASDTWATSKCPDMQDTQQLTNAAELIGKAMVKTKEIQAVVNLITKKDAQDNGKDTIQLNFHVIFAHYPLRTTWSVPTADGVKVNLSDTNQIAFHKFMHLLIDLNFFKLDFNLPPKIEESPLDKYWKAFYNLFVNVNNFMGLSTSDNMWASFRDRFTKTKIENKYMLFALRAEQKKNKQLCATLLPEYPLKRAENVVVSNAAICFYVEETEKHLFAGLNRDDNGANDELGLPQKDEIQSRKRKRANEPTQSSASKSPNSDSENADTGASKRQRLKSPPLQQPQERQNRKREQEDTDASPPAKRPNTSASAITKDPPMVKQPDVDQSRKRKRSSPLDLASKRPRPGAQQSASKNVVDMTGYQSSPESSGEKQVITIDDSSGEEMIVDMRNDDNDDDDDL